MKIVVISGSSKGIGAFLANRFLQKGHIVVGCSRGAGAIDHENYRHHSLDISDETAVKAMVRAVKLEFGQVDILLNNAGTAAMNHLLTTPYESVQRIFGTNFFGTFLLVREVAKMMTRRKSGRIVNFSTVAVGLRLEGEAVYAASKAAINSFTQIAAKDLGAFNITVNAVGPTPIKTDLIRHVADEKIEALVQQQALKRLGNFEDVANVIDFFTSDKSDFITGQIVYLGGVNG
ncbi:SDR family NAD(P)-dependent oxidoreductase [Kordiimonas sp.]|uniref:SDR family NAD(P)-dependent oxidoreductase n=1 Tax=Kordiimonas sp. TaxID=1970157 RepID=UPI003A94250A